MFSPNLFTDVVIPLGNFGDRINESYFILFLFNLASLQFTRTITAKLYQWIGGDEVWPPHS